MPTYRQPTVEPGIPYEPEGIYLSAPYEGRCRVLQGWGNNPGYYAKIHIGNLPLKGHNGIDLDLSPGTSILAVDDGEVIEIGHERHGYGRYLVLQHRWGESLYAHLQEIEVTAGELVPRLHRIGKSGNSGESSQPHLHLGIRIYPYDRFDGWGGYTDPLPFLNPQSIQISTGN